MNTMGKYRDRGKKTPGKQNIPRGVDVAKGMVEEKGKSLVIMNSGPKGQMRPLFIPTRTHVQSQYRTQRAGKRGKRA